MEKARLMLVDDHVLFRSALGSLIARQPDMEVVAEADSGSAAIQLSQACRPDLILMDINMSGKDGLAAAREIKRGDPSARICMLTATDDDDLLCEAIRSGAQGYLLKHIEPGAFIDEIRRQLFGEPIISEDIAARIVRAVVARRQRGDEEAVSSELSPRELEVLKLVGLGKTNREIAQSLATAENTVKNHLRHIVRKLHVDNRVQAAAYAIRHGLLGS